MLAVRFFSIIFLSIASSTVKDEPNPKPLENTLWGRKRGGGVREAERDRDRQGETGTDREGQGGTGRGKILKIDMMIT